MNPMSNISTPIPIRFLRLGDVVALVAIRKTTLYALIKSGEFPAPVKIKSCSVWIEVEVRDWMQALAESHRSSIACSSGFEDNQDV